MMKKLGVFELLVFCCLLFVVSIIGCGSPNNSTTTTTTTTIPYSTILAGDAGEKIYAMAYDNTNGILYIGGTFVDVPSSGDNYIVKWNGVALEPVGNGLNGIVTGLKYDNTNNCLYASGAFTKTADLTIDLAGGMAKWNGTSWQAVGTAIVSMESTIIQDSSGNLYCGGSYHNGVKKWNGTTWETTGSLNGTINGLAYDNNSNYLYACGDFSGYVKKWNGTTWEALGTNGLWGGTITTIYTVTCNSSGELYISGDFTNVFNNSKANYILKWDGTSWGTVESSMFHPADTYAAAINNAGKLYIGEFFLNGSSFEAWSFSQHLPSYYIHDISFNVSNNIYVIMSYYNYSVTKWTN